MSIQEKVESESRSKRVVTFYFVQEGEAYED